MSRHLRLPALLTLLLPVAALAQIGPPPNPTATRPAVVAPPTPMPPPPPVRPVPADSVSGQIAPVKSNRQVQQQLR
ncbi:MAG TPA: classical arabinogalactan protein 4, partial [Stenotrophomonas sp.]|nr:classical arabinogalactan protein 4 [Stenotrophomonas sp.]